MTYNLKNLCIFFFFFKTKNFNISLTFTWLKKKKLNKCDIKFGSGSQVVQQKQITQNEIHSFSVSKQISWIPSRESFYGFHSFVSTTFKLKKKRIWFWKSFLLVWKKKILRKKKNKFCFIEKCAQWSQISRPPPLFPLLPEKWKRKKKKMSIRLSFRFRNEKFYKSQKT